MENPLENPSDTERALQALFGTGSARVRLVTHVSNPLRDRIQESAKRNSRSTSREIAHQLAKVYATEAVRASLATGGAEADGEADPSLEATQPAPPVASEPGRLDEVFRTLTTDPAEAGVTTGELTGQAEDAGVVEAASRAPAPQGNDLASTWKGPDTRSAKLRKLGK